MVHLSERIPLSKVSLIKIQSSLCDTEHQLMSQVLDERLSDENSLRDIHCVFVDENFVRTSTDGKEVRRYFWSLLKVKN
jgi:hypothetical protein